MEDKIDYEKLREFQKTLRDITVNYLKTKVTYRLNSKSNDELGLLISIIEKDSEHELYPEQEKFTFISAVCKELEAYIKELGFSRDPSTRKAGLEFLEETLCNIQILSDPYSKQITVTVDFKDYTIKGFSGFTSWSTGWLIKYPGAFANKLKSFSLKWKNVGVKNIIEELNPNESHRAIEEKKNTLLKQSRVEKESEVSTEEDSVVCDPDQTHQPHEDKKPLPNTAGLKGADSDSEEYTYESYYEDETEGTDDEPVGFRTPVKKASSRAKLISERSIHTPGGSFAVEQIWEESLDGDEEYSGEAESDAEEDEEYGRGHSPDRRTSTGLSVIKKSHPSVYERLVRRSLDRQSLPMQEDEITPLPQETDENGITPVAPSPMSALLADAEAYLSERSLVASENADKLRKLSDEVDADELQKLTDENDGDDDPSPSSVCRALQYE